MLTASGVSASSQTDVDEEGCGALICAIKLVVAPEWAEYE